MAYFSRRVRAVIGESRAREIERIFAHLDAVDAMLKNAEERTRREFAADPALAARIRKMRRARPSKAAPPAPQSIRPE